MKNVKFFSLFGKKPPPQVDTQAGDARVRADSTENMRANGQVERGGRTHYDRRKVARATELKIDAIESAMSLQLDDNPRTNGKAGIVSAKSRAGTESSGFKSTMQLLDAPTEILFDNGVPGAVFTMAATLPTPLIEEAAILFANDQQALAEHLLQNAIMEATPTAEVEHAYLLLFDLYQLSSQQQKFDSLTTDYISRFESSPPAWCDRTQQVPSAAPASSQPYVIFSKALDADSATQIERAQQLSAAHQILRLDFSRIRETAPAGCALLLQLLHSLRRSGHDLILSGAPELVERIQSTLRVGRRDASAAPWLLLLELLRLLGRKQAFEESSIEYCITFEISPPDFEAPRPLSPSAHLPQAGDGGELAPAASRPEHFLMPDIVTGDIRQLLEAITAFAAERETIVIDCSRLNRIDVSASGQLLTGLVPLTSSGKIIEFHEVNYPVAALLNVMGLQEIARIIPHNG
ncbi:MAG: STAS domain-containing protein [Glaciimonas sp.]|nr:STAS domain-containing protein [Glaciimonas sp.]